MAPVIDTVKARIAWSYANLARAHAALNEGATTYSRTHHVVRNRLFHGIMKDRMSMRPLFDDECLKMKSNRCCSYCGSEDSLSIDHLIPRMAGGADTGENLVLACRSCNSSKQGKDLMQWMHDRRKFPSILILRRYIKLIAQHCEGAGLLPLQLAEIEPGRCPFDLDLLPVQFPPLVELRIV